MNSRKIRIPVIEDVRDEIQKCTSAVIPDIGMNRLSNLVSEPRVRIIAKFFLIPLLLPSLSAGRRIQIRKNERTSSHSALR